MLAFFNQLNHLIWGPPLLLLLMGTGIFLTVRLGLLQVLKLPRALKLIVVSDDSGHGDVSSFAALCTALAATVGTGNIVGVATAIKLGGPGALFWMMVAAFFGMATKYAEGMLAIIYRTKDGKGNMSGGPMYYIIHGMGKQWRPLATFFAFSGVLVALVGTGTFAQVNAITDSVHAATGIPASSTAVLLALTTAAIIFGGIQSISNLSTTIVPLMALLYISATLWVIGTHANQILPSLQLVIQSAFTGQAATGGFVGASMMMAIQSGVARGIFSNESGLGSAPIAAAAAKTTEPVEQGLVSMTGTFIDTIIICHLTGLSILVTGVWKSNLNGASLTQAAFATSFGSLGTVTLTICLTLFAFTTILGWSYYGERCFEFLFGTRYLLLYRLIFAVMVLLGGFLELDLVWVIADIANGLMAFPNLIVIVALSPIIQTETKRYFKP